jgi:hypothetical protein
MERFIAIWGQGVGLQGQSYAIPTNPSVISAKRPDVKQSLEAQNKEYAGYKQAFEEVRDGEEHGHCLTN